MYHPYVRGKQFELITVKETAPLLAKANFVPIIEPVKETLSGLKRTLEAVCAADGRGVVVINPLYGDFSEDGEGISELLSDEFCRHEISAGVFLHSELTLDEAVAYCDDHEEHPLTLVHAGFSDPKALADKLGERSKQMRHVFFEHAAGKLYQRHFKSDHRVLIRDGFQRRKNRDYPDLELFSDLHITYPDEGMTGFGDFLIVGDDYTEGGGPAYAIAIHLTFIDPDKDNAMYIYHFKSKRMDTPTDPAGKFAEALDAMMKALNAKDSKVLNTTAVQEFRQLHAKGHFPGLGYVKKLSMQHHIETLARFFAA